MARDYANIITAIWRDARFRALCGSAQRTYLLLVTQPDISAAGTLPLTVRRWAQCAADTTPASIEADLKVLEATDFVFMDEETEELLIRTFAKHDKGYTNPKRKPVIVSAAKALESLKLRTVLWGELARLGLSDKLPALPETSTDSLSDTHTDTHTFNDRVVVQVGLNSPQPSNHDSQPVPPPAAGASAPAHQLALVVVEQDEPRTAQQIVGWWIDHCDQRPPGRVVGQMAKHVKELLDEGFQPVHIRQGIGEWAGRDQHPATLHSFVSNVANRRAPIRAAPPKTPPTETTLAHNQAIAAKFRAQEGSS